MKMKNMIAVMAATAVAATGFAAMSLSASAETVYGIGALNGQMGTYQKWDQTGSAQITGNGQYEATWDITGDGTGTIEFLILEIQGSDASNEDLKNFTSDQYVDMNVTIDELTIDGSVVEYTANDAATKLAHYENGTGRVRVYFTDTWNVNGGNNLGVQSAVTSQIKVKFTVTGLPEDAAVETTAPTDAPTDAPATDAPAADSTTTAAGTTAAGGTTTTAAKATTGTTTNAATGDTGIAVALAGLTAAGAVALVSKKRK